MSAELPKQIYRLCETVADIAYIAGHSHFHSGDSREDCQRFIEWAQEFEKIHAGKEWGTGANDYMEAIEVFAKEKLGI